MNFLNKKRGFITSKLKFKSKESSGVQREKKRKRRRSIRK